jgi:hypothetical protein
MNSMNRCENNKAEKIRLDVEQAMNRITSLLAVGINGSPSKGQYERECDGIGSILSNAQLVFQNVVNPIISQDVMRQCINALNNDNTKALYRNIGAGENILKAFSDVNINYKIQTSVEQPLQNETPNMAPEEAQKIKQQFVKMQSQIDAFSASDQKILQEIATKYVHTIESIVTKGVEHHNNLITDMIINKIANSQLPLSVAEKENLDKQKDVLFNSPEYLQLTPIGQQQKLGQIIDLANMKRLPLVDKAHEIVFKKQMEDIKELWHPVFSKTKGNAITEIHQGGRFIPQIGQDPFENVLTTLLNVSSPAEQHDFIKNQLMSPKPNCAIILKTLSKNFPKAMDSCIEKSTLPEVLTISKRNPELQNDKILKRAQSNTRIIPFIKSLFSASESEKYKCSKQIIRHIKTLNSQPSTEVKNLQASPKNKTLNMQKIQELAKAIGPIDRKPVIPIKIKRAAPQTKQTNIRSRF